MRTCGILLLVAALLCIAAAGVTAAEPPKTAAPASHADVVAAFITVNAYGNNLYLDNVTAGRRFTNDVALMSLTNIAPDTSYSFGSSATTIAPKVLVVNVGRGGATPTGAVVLTAEPGGYSSVRMIGVLPAGWAVEVTFDDLTIPASTAMTFTAVAVDSLDQHRSNDTLRQSSIFLPGVRRRLLLEEWTSSTCAPCASNNPTVDAFITARFDSVVAVKYHVGWPSPGDDPMYLHNPTQSYDRRYYYGVNAVPHVIMDGLVNPAYPYSTPGSLENASAERWPVATPVSLTVTDERIAGDSIRATVEMTIHAPLRAGSYKLRVQAVQRQVHYTTAPGTNGETDFFDVFRRAYPNSTGTTIPTSVGTHSFTFTYRVDTAVWVDSLMYTLAFVQNDATKEVLNCAKGYESAVRPPLPAVVRTASPAGPKDRCIAGGADALAAGGAAPPTPLLAGVYHYELFEGAFPPPGWRLANPNADITMEWFTGISGPTFGGVGAVKMDFYSYGTTGRTDTLFTRLQSGMAGNDTLRFDWAYAEYPGYADRLIVKLSTNGGATFPHTVFDRSGATLATAPSTTGSFVPSGASQWQSMNVPLAAYLPLEAQHQQQVSAQWNMLSMPMTLVDPRASAVYPTASSQAFRYAPGAGYQVVDSTLPGFGYWLKFPSAQTVAMWGYPVAIDSPQVAAGWNLVGATSNVVPVSVITTSPPGILDSPFFSFGPSGYTAVTQLEPGRGYFVKVSQAGRINIPAPVSR